MQIRAGDNVTVYKTQGSDTHADEFECDGRAKTPRADKANPGVFKCQLPIITYIRKDNLPRISMLFVFVEFFMHFPPTFNRQLWFQVVVIVVTIFPSIVNRVLFRKGTLTEIESIRRLAGITLDHCR